MGGHGAQEGTDETEILVGIGDREILDARDHVAGGGTGGRADSHGKIVAFAVQPHEQKQDGTVGIEHCPVLDVHGTEGTRLRGEPALLHDEAPERALPGAREEVNDLGGAREGHIRCQRASSPAAGAGDGTSSSRTAPC